MVQDALGHSHVIIRQRGKKYQGEVTRGYLEALAHLAGVMEEKEYWQFSIDEVCLWTLLGLHIFVFYSLVNLSFINICT